MTQKEKQYLLVDICARLPYSVEAQVSNIIEGESKPFVVSKELTFTDVEAFVDCDVVCDIKPYLRPMSSMIEEERIEFSKLLVKRYCEEDWEGHISTSYCIEIDNVYTDDENSIKYPSIFSMDAIDWLNSHHFDYRGLIPMGLALPAPDGMYR